MNLFPSKQKRGMKKQRKGGPNYPNTYYRTSTRYWGKCSCLQIHCLMYGTSEKSARAASVHSIFALSSTRCCCKYTNTLFRWIFSRPLPSLFERLMEQGRRMEEWGGSELRHQSEKSRRRRWADILFSVGPQRRTGSSSWADKIQTSFHKECGRHTYLVTCDRIVLSERWCSSHLTLFCLSSCSHW